MQRKKEIFAFLVVIVLVGSVFGSMVYVQAKNGDANGNLEFTWPRNETFPNVMNTPEENVGESDDELPEGVTVLEWMGPHGSFDDYNIKNREINPVSIQKIGGKVDDPAKPIIIIFIDSALMPNIESEISIYNSTLVNNGYNTVVIKFLGGTVEDMKDQILSYWNAGYNVKGAVLIGNLPVAWYHHEWDFDHDGDGHGDPAEFPCDLFLMDLDGKWVDSDGDGLYDDHTDGMGDTAPEIYVGRIDASNVPGDEITIIKNYLQKVHEYWIGNISHTDYGLTYTDKDWNCNNDIRFGMGYGYDTYEAIWYPNVNRDDYINNRLPDGYEFIQLACHSWSGGHSFTIGGWASSDDIRSAPPMALFYNLFCCGALRFTDYNCVGNAYILNTRSPSLAVVGSTKSGSMLNFRDFYELIGQNYSFGEAFRTWFEKQYPYFDDPDGYNEVSWYYGMTILGDPTLIPKFSPNLPPTANFTFEPENSTTSDTIYFNSTSTDSDGYIVNWTWNLGDGTTLYGENITHKYANDGTYNVTLTVRDDDGATDSITKQISVGNVLSSISIIKPRGHLYIFDKEIMSLPANITVIIGKITIEADAQSPVGIEKVEFYIDGKLKGVAKQEPYQWIWDEKALFMHKIKVIAYDKAGNNAIDEQKVLIFHM